MWDDDDDDVIWLPKPYCTWMFWKYILFEREKKYIWTQWAPNSSFVKRNKTCQSVRVLEAATEESALIIQSN